ncbi:Tektin-2 [Clonorchis sinensis]|uniref:Tektin n=1 Tax=Clonorchis sinensis TaxID=79923 RepID=A0A8T1MYZ0_CLOSI|nr:Tektin-2 [Clonorchis sinensis]
MATLTKPEEKTDYPSWFTQLHAQSRAATDSRRASSEIRERSRAMRIETDAKTKWDQYDTNNRLVDRIWTLRQWRDELAAQLRRLKERMADLRDTKMLTEDYMVKLADAQQVNTEVLTLMDRRRQGEYILDPVEVELKGEQVLLKEIYDSLQGQILEAFETLIHMQEAADALEKDVADKNEAMRVDIDQYNLTEKSANIGFKPFATRKPELQMDLQSWEELSRKALERAKTEVDRAAEVIHSLHLGLHQAANRMLAKSDRVADAIRMRLHDTERAIRELEVQRDMTEKEREKLQMELRNIEEARRAKYATLKLAQTRLEGRHDRPGNENIEDAAHAGLLEELKGIVDSIDALDEQIDKSRAVIGRLDSQLARLCQEGKMKRETLQVFQELVNIRKRLETPPHTRYPYCPMIPEGIIRQPVVF